MVALGLCCCEWAFSNCAEQGLLFVVMHRLLIVVASPRCRVQALGAGPSVVPQERSVVSMSRIQGTWASVVVAYGLSSSGEQALVTWGMWNLPRPGIELMSPALAGGFLSTVPLGKSRPVASHCSSLPNDYTPSLCFKDLIFLIYRPDHLQCLDVWKEDITNSQVFLGGTNLYM